MNRVATLIETAFRRNDLVGDSESERLLEKPAQCTERLLVVQSLRCQKKIIKNFKKQLVNMLGW